MSDACEAVIERNHLNKNDIDRVIPHQANQRIISAVTQRLGAVSYTHLDVYKRQAQILAEIHCEIGQVFQNNHIILCCQFTDNPQFFLF